MTFWTCSSVAVCSITMTMTPSLLGFVDGQPLQAPAFVDDSFEDALHRRGIQRSGVLAHHPLQDLGLALRGVDGQAQLGLEPPDLHRAGRAAVQQSHELRVDQVDAVSPFLDVLHGAPLSHATWVPRSASGRSSSSRTSALPTTTPSAADQAAATCSGVEMPKPRTTGSGVSARRRPTR